MDVQGLNVRLCLLLVTAALTLGKQPEVPEPKTGNAAMDTSYACVENGTLIGGERVCDGRPDCGRLEDDEAFCLTAPQPFLCRDLSSNSPVYNCLDGVICIPHDYFCDGYVDCATEEDELNCDQQYIPGCNFGVLHVTCTNVTLNESYDRHVPNNIRFMSLRDVYPPASSNQTLGSLIALERFPYLVKLYLVNNNLTSVHLGEPDSLMYLRSLHVSYNKIRTIGATALLAAPNLVHLEIPHNQIVCIEPGAFHGMTSLVKLDIMRNNIETLHVDTFKDLFNLEIINMSHNNIGDLEPGTFKDLSNLTYLTMSNNNMRALKRGTFLGLSSISSLYINDIPIDFLEPGALDGLHSLHSLHLLNNALDFIYPDTFRDLTQLQHLAITGNFISTLHEGSFKGLRNVMNLNLINNSISNVRPGAFHGLDSLLSLDLGDNSITELKADTFAGLSDLQILWMRNVPIKHIEPGAFRGLSNVVSLNILDADLEAPTLGILEGLDNLTTLSTTDRRLCCILDPTRNISCIGPPKSFTSCQRLMPNAVLRVAIWLLGISAIIGNTIVVVKRVVKRGRRDVTVQSMLITHLAISDSLMGAYMIAIGAADLHFGESYFLSSQAWRTGAWCKAIGFVSVLSSEASVFLVMLISMDRFISIAFPFSRFRLDARYTRITVVVMWLIAFGLSLIGTIMADTMPSFYGLSDVCVGLPLITSPVNQTNTWVYSRESGTFFQETSSVSSQPAWAFSVFLYLGLNLVCFTVVLVCYVLIFIIVRQSSRSVSQRGSMAGKPSNGAQKGASHRSITHSREVKLACRMALVVGTDFLCWMPIIIMGILTQSGAVSVPEELYAWTVVFILPINSSLNPYLYTISEICSKSRKKTKKTAQGLRMTYTLPRNTEHDRMMNSAVES